MASSIFRAYVLPSVSWGSEFFAHSPAALHLLDGAIRRWGRHVLGWPPGSPCAGVLCELGWPHAEHLALGRLLSLLGRSFSMAQGLGCPLPATVLSVATQSPETWAHHALAICAHLGRKRPTLAKTKFGQDQIWPNQVWPSVAQIVWKVTTFHIKKMLNLEEIGEKSKTGKRNKEETLICRTGKKRAKWEKGNQSKQKKNR